mgnify:CR=1 FL=1
MNEDKIIEKLIEHDARFDECVTKDEFHSFREELRLTNDQMMVILKRLDEERYFTAEWIRRVEDDVKILKLKTQEHEEMLYRVKKELHIA